MAGQRTAAPPYSTTADRSCPWMQLLDRVRQFDPPARPGRSRHPRRRRRVRRIRFGGARAPAARARRGRRAAARRPRALQSSAARRGGPTTSGSARRVGGVARRAAARRIARTSRRCARRERRSIEDAARAARYAFFERARAALRRRRRRARPHARRSGRDVSAAAGARRGPARARRRCIRGTATIVRPLLDCRRARASRRGSSDRGHRRSSRTRSNADVGIPRNRVRAELLPLLEARFNPAIVDVLADEAEMAREDVAVAGSCRPASSRRGSCAARRRTRCRCIDVAGAARRCRWRFAAAVLWRAMSERRRRPAGFVRPRRGGARV